MAVINGGFAEISWLNQRIRDLEKQNVVIAREQARKIEELKSSVERLMGEKAAVYRTGGNIGVLKRVDAGGGSSDFMERFVNGLKKHKDLIRDLSIVGIGLAAVFLVGFEYGCVRTSSKVIVIDMAQMMGGSRR